MHTSIVNRPILDYSKQYCYNTYVPGDDLSKYKNFVSAHERLYGEPPCDYEQGYEDGYFEKPMYKFPPGVSPRYLKQYEQGWDDGYEDRQREKNA